MSEHKKHPIDSIEAALKRERQRQARLELNLNFKRNQLRKTDVRHKIQLGGLIIKAGLGDAPKAVLLGLLAEAKIKLENPKHKVLLCETWRQLGNVIFEKDRVNKKTAPIKN